MSESVLARSLRSLQRNILAGIHHHRTAVRYLPDLQLPSGHPGQSGFAVVWLLAAIFPGDWLAQPWLQSVMAVVLTLVVLFVVGRVTSQVVGRQAFKLFEAALDRLPFVAKVYTSVRQLLDSMMAKNESSQRVVLVDFPIPGQKSIGFLTRTMTDETTGETAGCGSAAQFHQPDLCLFADPSIDRVTETDMNMEQAMSMLMTGGAVGPDKIRFTKPALPAPEDPTPPAPSA